MTQNAELPVFLAVAIGYWIGQFKFKGVGLGPVTGSLLAGLLIGNFFHVPVAETAKSFLFLLFMFGIGYSAGPGFIRGIRDGGWRWIVLAFVIPLTGLFTAVVMAKILHLEMGYAAGMLSGAMTESPIIGTASEAIQALPISADEKHRLISQIPVADALTYIFGTLGVIFFCSYIGPWMLRLDLRAEALRLEQEMGIEREKVGVTSAWRQHELRAYRINPDSPWHGQTVAQVEGTQGTLRVFVERVRRGDQILEAEPHLVLQAHDVVAVHAPRRALIEHRQAQGLEVSDRELLDIDSATFKVELTNRALAGKTLSQIASDAQAVHGVFLKNIQRGQEQIPIAPGTVLQRGDWLTIHGLEPAVQRVSKLVGVVAHANHQTNFVVLGLAIFIGAFSGIVLTFPVGGLHIAVGSSVATLIAGLLIGWRNSVQPMFGQIPAAALEFMKSMGLAAFVAMIGLKAGPVFIVALQQVGLTVFLGGMAVTLVPQLVGLVVGRYLLGLNPLLLLGALAGAQTMTAGLAALQERSESPVAVIGYSSVVAFGHILLSIMGTALIWILH